MLSPSDRLFIMKRVDFIQAELEDLAEYLPLNFSGYSTDRKLQRNLERLAENIANALIDLSKIILSNTTQAIPDTYRDIILKAGELESLDPDHASKIADIARLRNILAHQYLDIKWDALKFFIAEADKIIQPFLSTIKERYLTD
jgi:uncharacterized protein YutE (UPF0331/DUF86 family)